MYLENSISAGRYNDLRIYLFIMGFMPFLISKIGMGHWDL